MGRPTITVLIDLPAADPSHRATVTALGHAVEASGRPIELRLVGTGAVVVDDLGDGVVIGPGSPYRDPAAAEAVIRSARERGVPLVGT